MLVFQAPFLVRTKEAFHHKFSLHSVAAGRQILFLLSRTARGMLRTMLGAAEELYLDQSCAPQAPDGHMLRGGSGCQVLRRNRGARC